MSCKMRWYATYRESEYRTGSTERQSTYNENELQVIDKRPFDCISILLVLAIGATAFDERLADEGIDGGGGGCCGMGCCRGEGT